MTNISFRAVVVALVVAVCAQNLFSQETPPQTAVTDAAEITLSTDESAILLNMDGADTVATPARSGGTSGIFLFVQMVLVLALVVAIIYGVVFFMRRTMRSGAEDDPFLRKVSQITLSPGKSVQIVTLYNRAYLLGVSDSAINLLGEVTDEQFVNSMNVYADQNGSVTKPRSFADILNLFMPNSSRTPPENGENAFENREQAMTESLQRQRERLNGEAQ